MELNGAPSFFAVTEKRLGGDVPQVFRELQTHDRCYSVLVYCSADRIKTAKFYAELKDKLLRDLPPQCHFSPMSSFLPNVKDSLVKGYFLKGSSDTSSPIERLLSDLVQHDPVLVCSYSPAEGGQQWSQRVWSQSESQMMDMAEEYHVVPAEAPDCHPSTLNIINSDVFYSFHEAYDVMKKVRIRSHVQGLFCSYSCGIWQTGALLWRTKG